MGAEHFENCFKIIFSAWETPLKTLIRVNTSVDPRCMLLIAPTLCHRWQTASGRAVSVLDPGRRKGGLCHACYRSSCVVRYELYFD